MEAQSPKRLNLHPFIRQVTVDKVRGAVIGAALGDSIGLYTEFLDKDTAVRAYPDATFRLTGNVTRFYNDSHRNKFFEGSWTDDTDHALLIILSYLHHDGKKLLSQDLAVRLKVWIEQGLRCLERLPLGLGRATGSVVMSKDYCTDPRAAALQHWANSDFNAAPNGSLMRTYPLEIMCMNKTLEQTFGIAADFCVVTHADPRCIVSCCIATAVIRATLLGELDREPAIDQLVDQASAYVEAANGVLYKEQIEAGYFSGLDESGAGGAKRASHLDRQELYKHTSITTFDELELDDLRKQGYVYKCLGAGLLCLRLAMRRLGLDQTAAEPPGTFLSHRRIFEQLITDIVMQGGDADTNATVAGAFLGCLQGFSQLPAHWYEGIRDVKWLASKADALINVVGIDPDLCAAGYIGSHDPDTRTDGGKETLTRPQLEMRERDFMEIYLKKTMDGRSEQVQTRSSHQSLLKKWKSVFT